MSKTWPYSSLTQAPTNLKEAIDWVLRVTGRDGKKNEKQKDSGPHCLCYLAKAIKDLLYDAKDPGYPGPHPDRYWDNILLKEESTIAQPVLEDLGLLSTESTSATSTSTTCAGGTEVIGTLIDQLAQGLQKWVGWQDKRDECCLKGDSGGVSKGIGKKCDCSGVGTCCSPGGPSTTCQCATGADKKCYQSAYCKKSTASGSSTADPFLWTSISSDSTKVHLLARIFLGSVCLIWSGLSQLGFLTGGSGGSDKRWKDSKLNDIETGDNKGLGSFMAAMGYDLERLNGTGLGKGNGEFVQELLTGKDIKWKEFASVKSKTGDSVAEYYSTIYEKANGAAKGSSKNSESLCKDYPLLVLHILASGYFRAGSAGAKGITSPAKPPKKDTDTDEASKKPRHPRTIREILYWLSALPYSLAYKALVERMAEKFPPKENDPKEFEEQIVLHGENSGKTTLKRDCITHYLMAACGYCPLVLIGIQGTIEREVKQEAQPAASGSSGGSAGTAQSTNKCPEHKKNPSAKRCKLGKDAAQAQQQSTTTGEPLKDGQVCYGGYHLEVSKFGPLHGMYANGLYGFDMGGSAAQCLDQLRVYVYHCFYQLYFLRKQCTVGVESGSVLGWNSCRYGSGVSGSGAKIWICETKGSSGAGDHTKNCGLQSGAGSTSVSALQGFLCDAIGTMACNQTIGVDLNSRKQSYPDIEEHMNKIVTPSGEVKGPHKEYPELCPVPMGWDKDNHFKDLTKGTHKQENLQSSAGRTSGVPDKYPAHCTGNTLSHLLEYYCDPKQCHGSLVVLLRLLACITPTVPRTLGDLFGFYYYIVYIGGQSGGGGQKAVQEALGKELTDVRLAMIGSGADVVKSIEGWKNGNCSGKGGNLKCLTDCSKGAGAKYLSPLSGQQYGQLSPLMAGTYLSWLVYLIGEFQEGLKGLKDDYRNIVCKDSCSSGTGGVAGCGGSGQCHAGTHGTTCSSSVGGVCGCPSVVSCTGVLPVLYRHGFSYGNPFNLEGYHQKEEEKGDYSIEKKDTKHCHEFLDSLSAVIDKNKQDQATKEHPLTELLKQVGKLQYDIRLPWIFVLTVAWLVAVLYLAFGAIWPLDWTHMRSHCRGWFRKGSLSPWEVLMVGKKKGRSIVEYFGRK